MKITFRSSVIPAGIKASILEELMNLDEIVKEMNPRPYFTETDEGFIYETSSGKGLYTFDFSEEGRIIVNCNCYRQSLIDGTAFFKIEIPVGVSVNDLTQKTESNFILYLNGGTMSNLSVSGIIEGAESSKPDRQIIPGMNFEEFVNLGIEEGYISLNRSEKTEMFGTTQSSEDDWWWTWDGQMQKVVKLY